MLALALGCAALYAGFVIWRLGVHQRLPLILSPISLEAIPDRAARRHGERPLFSCDTPVAWSVPQHAERYPDAARWSAVRIRDTAALLAGALAGELDVGRGERIAIVKANHFDIHLLIAGCVRAGAIACPLNGRFAARHLQPYLANIGARLLVGDSATLARLLREGGTLGPVEGVILAEREADAAPADVAAIRRAAPVLWIEPLLAGAAPLANPVRRGAEDPVYLTHSSGTTGFPKAVILKNGAQSHAVRGWLAYVHLSRRDRGYLAVPNNHQAVILTFNAMMLLGMEVHWTASYGMGDSTRSASSPSSPRAATRASLPFRSATRR
jgi:acyl-coenzyme A synthetase/AMP-(fatty) acid ligase